MTDSWRNYGKKSFFYRENITNYFRLMVHTVHRMSLYAQLFFYFYFTGKRKTGEFDKFVDLINVIITIKQITEIQSLLDNWLQFLRNCFLWTKFI